MDNERGVQLIRALYAKHSAGGPMHIVTDDSNVDDHSLEFCIGKLKGDPCEAEARSVIEFLRPLTEKEREEVIDEFWVKEWE